MLLFHFFHLSLKTLFSERGQKENAVQDKVVQSKVLWSTVKGCKESGQPDTHIEQMGTHGQ